MSDRLLHKPLIVRSYDDKWALKQFVQEGYVVYRDVFDPQIVSDVRGFVIGRFNYLSGLSALKKFDVDVNGWSVAIMEELERTQLYDSLVRSQRLIELAKSYVGPDVLWFAHDGLFINVPSDDDPVLVKGHHTDVWTGTGVNTVFAALFLTDVDEHNGLTVCPGSHLQGLMPVRNRKIDGGLEFETRNLSEVRAGDLVVWHALLIHSTTGHSDKNMRISITSRFTSTETVLTSQERALGYRTLSVGPLNQVLRLVGNDHLLPFRTHGGYVGIDRRMAGIYDCSPYKDGVDYGRYLKDFV